AGRAADRAAVRVHLMGSGRGAYPAVPPLFGVDRLSSGPNPAPNDGRGRRTRRRRAVVAADGGSTCRSEAPLTGPTLFLARAGTHRTLRTTRATSPLRDLPGLSAADPDSLTFPGTGTAPGKIGRAHV